MSALQLSAIEICNLQDEKVRLEGEVKMLREALLISKGLLDAMMFIKEEPHEGSYGWIINQALSITEVKP